jgi:TetR/AcrR family transcriptional regulator, fatty acid metabolism regulator protein
METKPKSRNKVPLVIGAALKVFGEKGFYNATISEIARKAKVSEATVYEYFGSKEDLLFAIPEEITRRSVEFLEAMLPYIKGAENRLRALIYGYFTLYRDNPQYSSLVLLNLKHNRKFMETEGYGMVRRAAQIILEMIRQGVESGEFRGDLDPYLARSMVLGTIEHVFFRWHLTERRDELVDFTDSLMEILMRGMRREEEPRAFHLDIDLARGQGLEKKAAVKKKAGAKTAGA